VLRSRSIAYTIVLLLAAAGNTGCASRPAASAAVAAESSGPIDVRLVQSFRVEPDVEFLAWSADESKIATAGQLGRVLQIWNWRDRKILARLMKPNLGGHAIWFDNERVVTTPLDMDPSDALNLWDFQSGAVEKVPMPAPPLRDEGGRFVMSASGTRLTLLRNSHRAIVFDTKTW
jgi:hypothetical protein